MTIDEAIKRFSQEAEVCEGNADNYTRNKNPVFAAVCAKEAADHRQLAEWLTELKELSLQIAAPRLGSIEEYHYELARCKTAFWSCNKHCMDAEEQYRRKADELRKAQEQIAEYKRLLKAAMEDMKILYETGKDEGCIGIEFKWRYADEALKLIGGSENG